jgi:streptomycin 6-kinase
VTQLAIPETVRNRAIAAGLASWVDSLPDLVGELEAEWGFRCGEVLSGGSEAFVAEAVLDDGRQAVFKLLLPHDPPGGRNEIAVLNLVSGDIGPAVFRSDPVRFAILLELLGPQMSSLQLPTEQQLDLLCDAARAFWRPAPDLPLMTGAEKGRWLIEFIEAEWERLDQPCSREAVDYGFACLRRRIAAHDASRAVLTHGDIHSGNALQAGDGFKLIDPDGLIAEPEYDLGVILRAAPVRPGDTRALAQRLATRGGCDAAATWEWAAGERLSTALVCLALGLGEYARPLFQWAEVAAEG